MAKVPRRTRYRAHLHPEPVQLPRHNGHWQPARLLLLFPQQKLYHPAHTRQAPGDPTKAGVKYTRAEYFPSSQNRFFPSVAGQILFARPEQPLLQAWPARRHLHTIDPSTMALSARRIGRHAVQNAYFLLSRPARPALQALPAISCAPQTCPAPDRPQGHFH